MHLVHTDDRGVLCLGECSMFEPVINMWISKPVGGGGDDMMMMIMIIGRHY